MKAQNIDFPDATIASFCRRWNVVELSLFGSVLRDDFRPGSDIDILFMFAPGAQHSLLDHARMQGELETLLGRRVDLVNRRSVEQSDNWIRRKSILDNTKVIYAAAG